ncbi:MAG: TIGR00159 family protein [Firmicutes bacterium]|nr:TIGR00159 family protein [Bacillota bacterium]
MELWQEFTAAVTSGPVRVGFVFVDLFLVAFIIWRLFLLLRGTKGIAFLSVLAALLALQVLTSVLPLPLFNRFIQLVGVVLLVAFPALFQTELRRALERLGRRNPLSRLLMGDHPGEASLQNIARAASEMAAQHIGGLIVIERDQDLGEIAATGVKLDAELSKELLVQLFARGPLHDGAVVVKGRRILAAACLLPLSERTDLGPEIGTRHRAGLGMAEATDAVVVIVSEERGTITLAADGAWEMGISPEYLSLRLAALLLADEKAQPSSGWRQQKGGWVDKAEGGKDGAGISGRIS